MNPDPHPLPPIHTPIVRHAAARLATALRVIIVRLRFLVLLAAVIGIVSQWETLRTYAARFLAPAGAAAGHAVSSNVEFFCPMDPGVVSDWPGKCGVCNMALVRRARGDMAPLPEGVLARVQLTPYRIQLAGIRTAPVEDKALMLTRDAPGQVIEPPATATSGATLVRLTLEPEQSAGLRPGLAATIEPLDQPLSQALDGRVLAVEPAERAASGKLTAVVDISRPGLELPPGHRVIGHIQVPVVELADIQARLPEPPPLRDDEPRRVYESSDQPGKFRLEPATSLAQLQKWMVRDLAPNERLRWGCARHPDVLAEQPGATCKDCGDMPLVPRIVRFRNPDRLSVIPASAVVDTGTRRIVFVEQMPGTFDAVEVELGPRCGDEYPVLAGLQPGQRVAALGAFLLDAETRLNPALAAAYFGAEKSRIQSTPTAAAADTAGLDELPPAEREAARAQSTCPVTGMALGSMGKPPRVDIQRRTVYLCCEGCEPRLRKNPEPYLAKLPAPAASSPPGEPRR